MQKETDLLERPMFMNPGPAPSHMRGGGEIHTFPAWRWFASEVWAYFLEPGTIITTSGVRGRHSSLTVPGKMGISPPL